MPRQTTSVLLTSGNESGRIDSKRRGEVPIYYGEKFNSITHLIGAALSIAGTAVLVTLACMHGDVWKIVSSSIYGGTLIFLYSVSTIYHSIQGHKKRILQKLDHIAIYLLIAGSYTPFTLITLRGSWGWWIFGINWALALFGIIYELTLAHKTRIPSLITYVVMGWLVVIAFKPLMEALSLPGIVLLSLGGILYTGGIVFYIFDEKIKHFHGIWHLFVMAGSLSQFLCIIIYVI